MRTNDHPLWLAIIGSLIHFSNRPIDLPPEGRSVMGVYEEEPGKDCF